MKTEIIVFGVIIAVVIVGTLLVKIPVQSKTSLPYLGTAPDFSVTNWINTKPLTINDLKGKAVLIDFWTYSCINCIRTLPYLIDWNNKYSDKGLVIIGVHTPEFEFEKNPDNVISFAKKYNITYPIAQDNNYGTWTAYKNNYWPRHYLIDKEGNIRYDHIGEGGYDETEHAIQDLLGESENMTSIVSNTNFSEIGSPEIYLGYSYAREPIGNPEGFSNDNTVNYLSVNINETNTVYLSGYWKSNKDNIFSVNSSKVYLVYKAKNVNIVAGGSGTVNVILDDNSLDKNSFGEDVYNGTAAINGSRLYNVVSTQDYSVHKLELDFSPGIELYTFTFG